MPLKAGVSTYLLILLFSLLCFGEVPVTVHLVPNSHGTVVGWLVDFDRERNTVLNNYLDHLDRVASDPNYSFALSEVPNLITFFQFSPDRIPELKQRIRERRVELCNGFFLEPSVSLSGGEALVQMGVLGLRWYEESFSTRPRFCWMIDVVGSHRQLPQIVAGLGMEAMVFTRNNPARQTVFWWVAPDGSRTLAICNPRTYFDFRKLFVATEPLTPAEMEEVAQDIKQKLLINPSRRTIMALTGSGDYSLAPVRHEYPAEFLREWRKRYPHLLIRFSTPGEYLDSLLSEVRSGETRLEEYRGDTAYAYNAFWSNIPEAKQKYRRSEHLLQAAEMVTAVGSLKSGLNYPTQELYDAWIQLLLNTDRNILWGAGTEAPFRDAQHWNAWDRFADVQGRASKSNAEALTALAGEGDALAFFNPLNWERKEPVEINLPPGRRPAGIPCETRPDGSSLARCEVTLPSLGLTSFRLEKGEPEVSREGRVTEVVQTEHYTIRIDLKTGALTSVKLRPSGTEMLGGPANVIVAESLAEVVNPQRPVSFEGQTIRHSPADRLVPRPQRRILATSADYPARLNVFRGPLTTTIRVTSDFYGASRLERTVVLYHNHPRIDFETKLDLQTSDVLITADFPLRSEVVERTRGIPYGFASKDPRNVSRPPNYYLASDHVIYGYSEALMPSVRWSDYGFAGGGGVALLDFGLPSHELNGRRVTLHLINAVSHYRNTTNDLLRGKGLHEFRYALVPHEGSWQSAEVPRRAWEFHAPVLSREGARAMEPTSFVKTSRNLIVEAMRRVGGELEIRMYECSGKAGSAEVTLLLPHRSVALTNMMGEKRAPLAGGPTYRFPVRPQQIVTLRAEVGSRVVKPKLLLHWADLVPPDKRKQLEMRVFDKGRPQMPH